MSDAAVFSSHRVTGLQNSSVFELSAKSQATTRSGDPWLRWARVGNYAGWYSIGERSPDFGDALGFWEAVVTLATESGNGKLDAVHCIGPGILSIGGLGVTLASGYAQALLADCLQANPAHWIKYMGRVIRDSGAWIEVGERQGAWLVTKRGPAMDHESLNWAVRRGAQDAQWQGPQKHVGKVWVSGVSRMLRHPKMDQAQVVFCAQHAPDFILPMRSLIGWPQSGIRDGWMYTPEQQALWCVLMVAAIEDEDQTIAVASQCVQRSPVDARASLQNLYAKILRGDHTDSFVTRVRNAVVRSQQLFRIQVL